MIRWTETIADVQHILNRVVTPSITHLLNEMT